MNRQRSYWPLDDAPLKDGDARFVGVDERLDPELLAPGWVASATNCRFRNGRAEPRRGIPILPWMKADGRTPFTTTGAMHVFKVSPPNAYGNAVGTGAPFAPDGANDALIGVRFGEVSNLLSVNIYLDGNPPARWSSANSLYYPVGILHNGVLATTSYTSALNLQAQEVTLAISLNSTSNVLENHYLQILVTCTSGGGTAYLTYDA